MLKIKHLGRALAFEARMDAARDPEAIRAREEAYARARQLNQSKQDQAEKTCEGHNNEKGQQQKQGEH